MTSKKRPITGQDGLELADPLISKELGEVVKAFAGKFAADAVGELSAAKLIMLAGKVTKDVRDEFRAKKMVVFWRALEENTKSPDEFDALDEKDRDYIRNLVVTQLDMQSDERQSEVSALLVTAHLHKVINRMTLAGVIAEIKNINPLFFYFDEGEVSIDNPWNSKTDINVKGPVSLPASFGSVQGRQIRDDSIEAENRFALNHLGRAFYNYGYVPMSEKYSTTPSQPIVLPT